MKEWKDKEKEVKESEKELVKQMKISTKLIEYILLICEENEFSAVTKNNTLLLISKYIKSRGSNYSEDI